MVQPDRPQMTVRHMRIACWVRKGTDTLSEYVIRIALHRDSVDMNASQCYVIHTLPVLFFLGGGGGCCKCSSEAGIRVLTGLRTGTHRKWC